MTIRRFMDMWFDWDEAKAAANLTKHGIHFEEAQTVFGDEASITSYTEKRGWQK